MKVTHPKKTDDKSTAGFTMMELVVTLALMGILFSFAIPAYNGVSEEMQGKRNVANMHTILSLLLSHASAKGQDRSFPTCTR